MSVKNLVFHVAVQRPGSEQHFCGDKGYDYDDVRQAVAQAGYIAHIKRKRQRGEPVPDPVLHPAKRNSPPGAGWSNALLCQHPVRHDSFRIGSKFEKIEEQMILDQAAFDVDMKHLKEEWAQASQEAKAALKAEKDELKAKAQAAQAKVKAEMERLHNETDAKIGALKEQLKQAGDSRKAEIEKHIAEAQGRVRSARRRSSRSVSPSSRPRTKRGWPRLEKRIAELEAEDERGWPSSRPRTQPGTRRSRSAPPS